MHYVLYDYQVFILDLFASTAGAKSRNKTLRIGYRRSLGRARAVEASGKKIS